MNLEDSQIQQILNKPDNIRLVSLLASIDFQMTTFLDLMNEYGIEFQNKTNVVSLEKNTYFNNPKVVLLNYNHDVADSKIKEPTIITFTKFQDEEDEAKQIFSDGALLFIDASEGIGAQAHYQLRQAIGEKVKSALMIYELERMILEEALDGEQIYTRINNIIKQYNEVISDFQFEGVEEFLIDPAKGGVAFGSCQQQWAFTCKSFAQIYSEKFKIDTKKLESKLWGDNYFDQKKICWLETSDGTIKRSFVAFILDPIIKLQNVIMDGNMEVIQKFIQKLNLDLTSDELTLTGKQLLKTIMKKWLNFQKTILDMIVLNLPSPKQAQTFRSNVIIKGDQDDAVKQSINECNPKGPLVIQIYKMLQQKNDQNRFFAFGRIFSGTIKVGQNIKILGPSYQPGKKQDLFEIPVQDLKLITNYSAYNFDEIPCGNLVALGGIDQFITHLCSITDHPNCCRLSNSMPQSKNIFRISLKVKKAEDQPKLLSACQKLLNRFEKAKYFTEETGLQVIAGRSEKEVENYYEELSWYAHPIELIKIQKFTEYKETIISKSQQNYTVNSQNQRISLQFSAEPIDETLVGILENNQTVSRQDIKTRAQYLSDDFQWDYDDGLNIWSLDPQDQGANILVDQWKNKHDHFDLIKNNIVQSWQNCMQRGVLCQENVRGMRVNVLDVTLLEGNQRHSQEIQTLSKRLINICQLGSSPKLQEPMLVATIKGTNEMTHQIYATLVKHQGQVFEEQPDVGTTYILIKAYISAESSIEFRSDLLKFTLGTCYCEFEFEYWSTIQGDIYDPDSRANYVLSQIRKRKGIQPNLPIIEDFIDNYQQ